MTRPALFDALWTRKHDLPVSWDGEPVRWEAWEPDNIFLCPPGRARDRVCAGCGLERPKAITTGRYTSGKLGRLSASRCTACGHDTVYDTITKQAWDLDGHDYGDKGSTEPC